jgi:hypothetical protein
MGIVRVGRKKRADATGGPQTFRSPTAVVVWWIWLLFAVANLVDLAVQGRDHFSLVAAAILLLATGVAYVGALRPRIVVASSGLTVVNPLRDYHVGWAEVTKVDLSDLLRVHCQVQGRDKIVHAWAVHYSRRRQLTADARARRQAARASGGRSAFGLGGGYARSYAGGYAGGSGAGRRDLNYASATAPTAQQEAERIVQILNEHVTAAHAEAVWAGGTAETADASPPETGPEAAEAIETAGDATVDPRAAGWLEPLTSTWSRTALLALLVPVLILLIVALV